MKTKTPPAFTVAQAERIVSLNDADARALPDMLGRIAPAMLAAHGYYAATVGGVKTLYLLVPPYAVRKALREATLAVGRE
jgi:hypothetical protein